MPEQNPPHRRTPEEIAETSRLEYGSLDLSGMVGTSFPAILRLENYRSAPSHKDKYDSPEWHDLHVTDIHHIEAAYLYDALGVDPSAAILDIGCGDGSGILNHAMNFEHKGDLVGLNLSPASYFYGEQRAASWADEQKRQAAEEGREANLPNIQFMPGDAMNLPPELKQNKFFVTKLEYILYHLENPQKAIDEALETLAEGGFLVVSSRGEDNMEVMWKENLPRIGEIIEADPPSTFYADYPIAQMQQDMADRNLVLKASYSQKEPLKITSDRLDTYAMTHTALYNHFKLHTPIDLGNGITRPTPTNEQIKKVVDDMIVNPAKIKMSEDPDYAITDKVHQVFYIYQKPYKTSAPRRGLILPSIINEVL
jgi:SAM-dependent methyltransferase